MLFLLQSLEENIEWLCRWKTVFVDKKFEDVNMMLQISGIDEIEMAEIEK